MNYNITLFGRNHHMFDINAKLIIETAKEADYIVNTYPGKLYSPYFPASLSVKLTGSAKHEYLDFIVDYDSLYIGEKDLILNCSTLEIPPAADARHYYAISGQLFQIVKDLSPAYFTSFLLEHKDQNCLNIFKQHACASLPLKLQKILEQ